MEHLVVEDMHAFQRVQVLLQQGRSCRVQVHLVQLQDRYSHPEQSLVQGRVLARIKRIEIKKLKKRSHRNQHHCFYKLL